MDIAAKIVQIRQIIASAALRNGRPIEAVRLMAVTKTVEETRIREAVNAGVDLIGESYVQEARRKMAALGKDCQWHLIGRLQTNKARAAVRIFDMIHSVDRRELAVELDRCARAEGRRLEILIEVNCAGEATKSGIPAAAVATLVEDCAVLPNLSVRGLMTMPPWFDDAEQARPYFRSLRELAGRISAAAIKGVEMRELSMGMTGDYPVAVEEGATIVRIGGGIFGERS